MSMNNNRWLRFLTILLPLLSFSGLCCLPPAAEAQTTGSITGKVLDGNDPVPNFLVGVSLSDQNSVFKAEKTGADGSYTISGLQFGNYRIIFACAASELDCIDQWYNNRATFTEADIVSLTSGQATQDLGETVLVSGAVIKGTVTDQSSGKGIEGVTVQVIDLNDENNFLSDTTNSSGAYSISGLRAGSYKVRFRAFGTNYGTEWYDDVADEGDATVLTVTAGETKVGIDAILSTGGSISGKVTISETGAGISGAWINVYDTADNTLKGYTATGTDGSYTVGGLSASGSYKVQFFEKKAATNAGAGVNKWYNDKSDAATADSVSIGQTDVDAVFNGASISGTVTDSAGEGIAGVIVKAYDSSGSLAATSPATGTDGAYTVVGLQRDSYTLYFQADGTGYSSEWYKESSADAVDITSLGDALTGKDAELDLGVSISGTVTIKDGDSDPVPLEGGLVAVYDSADSSLLRGTATTGTDGIYEVTGLPAGGTFKVRFFRKTTANGSGYGTSEWYDDQPNFDQATEVQAGDTTVDAVLEPSNSLIPVYKLLLLKSRPQPENP
ncbi:hypothetical protein GCAAIG_06705 [Candidatus Electronema halotolerans]